MILSFHQVRKAEKELIAIVLLGFTAGVALATVGFSVQSQRTIKNIEVQRLKPTIHDGPAPNHDIKDDRSSQKPEAPTLNFKERRQLYERLERGRVHMFHGIDDHGIRETCEERCDELEKPCDIYEELQKLYERCKNESIKS